jgi:cytochrome c553
MKQPTVRAAMVTEARITYYPDVKTKDRWMFRVKLVVAVLVLAVIAPAQTSKGGNVLASQQPPPPWAFAVSPPNAPPKLTGDTPRHVPRSKRTFTDSQIADLFTAIDWHPGSHPPVPDIVGHGRKPDVYACGYCHLPNGQGRPENSSLAGLPKQYIIQQMAAFQSGARKSSEPKSLPVNAMIQVAAHADAKEVASAAGYFAGLKPKPWIRVVETATVPKTQVAGWMLVADEPVVKEPIGQRIIETPENLELTELRDDTSGFVAYVPPGSLNKGRELVTVGGNEVTMPCAMCHGPDLRGKDNVPSIAGRSPSYIVRQLYDIQIGSRRGAGTALMQAPVMKLTMDDMLAIAAYLASLKP